MHTTQEEGTVKLQPIQDNDDDAKKEIEKCSSQTEHTKALSQLDFTQNNLKNCHTARVATYIRKH